MFGEHPWGLGRILRLLKYLPPQSATHRVTTDSWDWRTSEELLATIAELIDYNNRILIKVNSDKHARQPEPIEIRRPYISTPEPKSEPRRQATHDEVVAFFKQRMK